MTSDGSNQNIIVNVNGHHFKFVDVNGDGDCFFHSMLKNQLMSNQFKNVQEMSIYLRQIVTYLYYKDQCMQQIFNKI